MGECARAGSTGSGGGALARAARGADKLRGLGALPGLRSDFRVLDAVEDADADLRNDEAAERAKRLRRAAGCSGEVSERPKLPPLSPAMSMVGAVAVADSMSGAVPGVEPGSVVAAVAALPWRITATADCNPNSNTRDFLFSNE